MKNIIEEQLKEILNSYTIKRRVKGITMSDISRNVPIPLDKSEISKFEKGKFHISMNKFLHILSYVGIPFSIFDESSSNKIFEIEKIDYMYINELMQRMIDTLKIIRKTKLVSLEQIAENSSNNKGTLSKIENNKATFYLDNFIEYLNMIGLKIKLENEYTIDKQVYDINIRQIYKFITLDNKPILENYNLSDNDEDMKILHLYKDPQNKITDFCNVVISINNIDIKYDLIESGFTDIIFHEEGQICIENPNNLYERFSKRGGIKFRLNNNDKVLITTDDTDLIIKIIQE